MSIPTLQGLLAVLGVKSQLLDTTATPFMICCALSPVPSAWTTLFLQHAGFSVASRRLSCLFFTCLTSVPHSGSSLIISHLSVRQNDLRAVKTHSAGPTFRVSGSVGIRGSLMKVCTSNNSPGDAADLGTTLGRSLGHIIRAWLVLLAPTVSCSRPLTSHLLLHCIATLSCHGFSSGLWGIHCCLFIFVFPGLRKSCVLNKYLSKNEYMNEKEFCHWRF